MRLLLALELGLMKFNLKLGLVFFLTMPAQLREGLGPEFEALIDGLEEI